MPRTRTISDQQVLNATIELVGRYGVAKLTFASLSVHTGLSAATLVQRFGTKKQLLTAVTKHCLQSMVPILEGAQNEHDSPLQAIYAAFESMAGAVTSVEEFANGQVFFYLALTDSETNDLLRQSMTESRVKIEQMLDEAVAAKELGPCDTNALALTLQSIYEGAITTWLVYQEGDIKSWVRNRLIEATKPYVTIS
ncbi:MAG: TetR family transcriptional regulator [Candidatus Saccharimonadales bacterium]